MVDIDRVVILQRSERMKEDEDKDAEDAEEKKQRRSRRRSRRKRKRRRRKRSRSRWRSRSRSRKLFLTSCKSRDLISSSAAFRSSIIIFRSSESCGRR